MEVNPYAYNINKNKEVVIMETKYLDKLYLPKKYIVVNENEPPELRYITTDLNEMLSKIGNTYVEFKEDVVKLSIYNLSADNKVIKGKCSVIESKNRLAKHAYHRFIYLSPSLDQIYSEVFHLWLPSDDNRIRGNGGYNYCYDYGILYGDYKLFLNCAMTKTNYLKHTWTENDRGMYGILDISLLHENTIEDLNKPIKLNNDIRCCYDAIINNIEKVRGTRLENWYYDIDEGCIPVSTFME